MSFGRRGGNRSPWRAGACQQPTAQQINTTNANSPIYIGALTCTVSGGTGYLFGSTKDLSCVYLTKDGVSQLYDGKIRKFGLDVGYTKASHMIWHVYQIAGLVGNKTSTDPRFIAGNYGGEQALDRGRLERRRQLALWRQQQPGRAAGDPAAGLDERRLQPGVTASPKCR